MEWHFSRQPRPATTALAYAAQAVSRHVQIDGETVAMQYLDGDDAETQESAHVHLEQGKKIALRVEYSLTQSRSDAGAVDLVEVRSQAEPGSH